MNAFARVTKKAEAATAVELDREEDRLGEEGEVLESSWARVKRRKEGEAWLNQRHFEPEAAIPTEALCAGRRSPSNTC
jgi:hypothetical protein